MQTFLPYRGFEASARALDAKRLGKQRVEVIQIVRALTVPGYAWKQHPAVLMWQGYEEALGRYGLVMCDVWLELGFGDTCAGTIAADLETFGIPEIRSEAALDAAGALPPWVADEAVRQSHQSALVRKDPEFYRRHFPDVRPDIDYVWPVRSAAVVQREERQRENAVLRQQRAEQKILDELAKAKRKRSASAKKAARTRAANAKARARNAP
ncbi:MSMEG_6728 family protein [uncultured Friedmanniella sp.]|uniref:MSMEG_6728 family protein n=1 Tax=uncultured Friedmanniella sp. TaxID=335381 RepID=UPI0035CAE1DA